jgi:ribonucleotide monophosphatase NagD (HAD superfamily)
MVMIGDRLDTDLMMAYKGGISKILTLTGVILREEEISHWVDKDGHSLPDFILPSFGILE